MPGTETIDTMTMKRITSVTHGLSFAVVLTTLSSSAIAEPVLEVYETYWPAEKVAPLVQDLLGSGDSISVYKNKIIIRTDRANHIEIQRILDEVDRPPRNLLVSLRRSDQHQTTARGVETSADYVEDNSGVRVERGEGDNNVVIYRGSSTDRRVEMRVMPRNSISTASDGSVHQVRVLEGEEGYISLGQEAPVREQIVTMNGVSSTTHYKPVTSGIYVVPKLQRDKVYLEISSHSQKMKGNNAQANIEVSTLNTVISAPLGLWTPLGGVDQGVKQSSSGIMYSTRKQGQQDLGYEIKVDVIE